jgi:hypothetical protein
VIEGDSVVILTKGQADTINEIFETQKKKIADARAQLQTQDSIIRHKDSLLKYNSGYYSAYKMLREEYTDMLILNEHTEEWIVSRAKEGAWLYYSYDSLWVEAVDLSAYKVIKNDVTGDIFFYRAENFPEKKKNDYPKRGWEKEVVLPNRPKINKL